jgi:hypothetical protein
VTAKRKLALVLWIAALSASACTNDDDPDPTAQPTDEPRVEQVATFQLVGTIAKAFEGAEAPFDVLDENSGEISGPTSSPSETPVGDAPSVPGVLRLDVEDVNQELTDACGVVADSEVRVYWTTSTRFDPSDVLDDIEDEITGEVAGISGRVFTDAADDEAFTPEPEETDEPTDDPDLTDASPFAIGSPDAGEDPALSADCVLVADQIGFEETVASTPAPIVRRTASPPTPAPQETDEPTASPDETDEPDETPGDTATPTASQDE